MCVSFFSTYVSYMLVSCIQPIENEFWVPMKFQQKKVIGKVHIEY